MMTSRATQRIIGCGSRLLLFPEFKPNLTAISLTESTPVAGQDKKKQPSWIVTTLERIANMCSLRKPTIQRPAPLQPSQIFTSCSDGVSSAPPKSNDTLESTPTTTRQPAIPIEEHQTIILEVTQSVEPRPASKTTLSSTLPSIENLIDLSCPADSPSEATSTHIARGWPKSKSIREPVLRVHALRSGYLKPMSRKEMVRYMAQSALEYRQKHGDDEEEWDGYDSSDEEEELERARTRKSEMEGKEFKGKETGTKKIDEMYDSSESEFDEDMIRRELKRREEEDHSDHRYEGVRKRADFEVWNEFDRMETGAWMAFTGRELPLMDGEDF